MYLVAKSVASDPAHERWCIWMTDEKHWPMWSIARIDDDEAQLTCDYGYPTAVFHAADPKFFDKLTKLLVAHVSTRDRNIERSRQWKKEDILAAWQKHLGRLRYDDSNHT